ncbi:MAG: hypothetical protein Q4F72_12985, partial [Desulfovibrionaceae bacterium]|nr:hypothetical protein [Desulfovibrionaceae bacterium]
MNDPGRKPLVLEGPLGVGKSWLLKNLASRQQQFHESVVLDFAENLEYLEKLFPQEVDPRTTPLKVVEGLRWATGGKLLPGHTLLIFDEPQLCPRALLTMTYFSPRMGFHVAAACSRPAASFDLPGGKAPAVDVPATMKKADILYSARRTGRAAFMEVHPLSFSEYLRSLGDGRLADAMAAQGLFGPMPGEIFGPLSEKFREYLCTGGMPAAVAAGRHARALARTDPSVSIADTLYDANYCQIVDWIATSWQGFGEDDGKLFMDVWRAVLTQLEQRDRVFDPEDHADYCCGSAEAVRAALNWLSTLGTIRLVPRCSTIRPGCLPFRVYLADTGPLNVIHKLSPSDVESAPGLCGLRGGVFAENLVLQALERALDSTTRTAVKYWSAFGYYEVQFLIPVGDAAIPAAIEKGDGSGAKSLGRYLKRHMGARNIPGILFTDGNLAMEGRVLHLPLFMAEHAVRLAE